LLTGRRSYFLKPSVPLDQSPHAYLPNAFNPFSSFFFCCCKSAVRSTRRNHRAGIEFEKTERLIVLTIHWSSGLSKSNHLEDSLRLQMWYCDSTSSFPSAQQTPPLLGRITQRLVHKQCRPVLSGATTTMMLRQKSGCAPGGYQHTLTTRIWKMITRNTSVRGGPELFGVDTAIGAVSTWRQSPTDGVIAMLQASRFSLLPFSDLTTILTGTPCPDS